MDKKSTDDLIKSFQDFLGEQKELSSSNVSLKEFISCHSPQEYMFSKPLREKLTGTEDHFCYPLMMNIRNQTLTIFSLIPFCALDSYNDCIPENGSNVKLNIKKLKTGSYDTNLDINFFNKKININFTLYTAVFNIEDSCPIEFPQDYFFKGYPILSELLSLQFFPEKNNSLQNKHYGTIKAITLSKI